MRKILILAIIFALFQGAYAASYKSHRAAVKSRDAKTQPLFTASEIKDIGLNTDGLKTFSGLKTFDELLLSHSTSDYLPSRKFVLEGNSRYFDGPDSMAIPPLEDYLTTTKSAAIGFSYPLSSKLSLNGGYALLNGKSVGNAEAEMQIPLFSALYRFNTRTSISITYKNVQPSSAGSLSNGSNHTDAELQIHF